MTALLLFLALQAPLMRPATDFEQCLAVCVEQREDDTFDDDGFENCVEDCGEEE